MSDKTVEAELEKILAQTDATLKKIAFE